MAVTSWASFTMRPGREAGALKLIRAVKRQAEREQPGTLVYLVHLLDDKDGKPGRTLVFYERYRNQAALEAHLASSSWQAVVAQWKEFFEGGSAKKGVKFAPLTRIAAFGRAGAIPVVAATR